MTKTATKSATRRTKQKAELVLVEQAPANHIAPAVETLKLSEVSKTMRKLIRQRATEENDTIIDAFKQALKNPDATEASIRTALTPTANSTIKTAITFKEGTVLKTSLAGPLRTAYKEAEDEMKVILTTEYQEQFQARPTHTPAQLKELDGLCRKADKPFKGKFR